MAPPTRSSIVLCLVAALLFGASTPASKSLLAGVGPLTLAGLLYLGAAVAVAPFALRGIGNFRNLNAPNLRRLAGSAAVGGGLAPVLLLLGLSRAPSASVAIWLTFEAALTAVLARMFFHESIGRRTWAAVALATVGNVVLAAPSDAGTLTAALLVGGACLCWALDNNLTSLIDGVTPAQTTLVKGVFAGTVNLVLGLACDAKSPTPGAVGVALLVGAVSYGASIVLYISSAQSLGAARSQILFATAPFLGMALAWTVFGEPALTIQVAAAAIVAAAVALMISDRHEHAHSHEPMAHTHAHRHDDGHHAHVHEGVAPSTWHTHAHEHAPMTHAHAHHPDLHHRHAH